ncbi:MAG: serine/threonine protein kinase [Myxococcales bacterium]|nr:serine/threonine protein kinase [Myxococcales bacterium]MCB9576150.1 serine/threonine protein kinase [Polyangiaceae bacterium]
MANDVFRIVGTTQAGAYQVEDVVGEGGFAVVYRAHHSGFRAKVALKCLKVPHGLGAEDQQRFLERFREEGELLFRLSAGVPSVVRPLHVGTLDTPTGMFVPFIALEWLDGEGFDQVLAKRRQGGLSPLPLKRVLRMLAPVAKALERAHRFPSPQGEMCILHRDLKPENIFVAKVHGQETCKILDFGIGKVKSVATQIVGQQSRHDSGIAAFTPSYGAPEQWLPKRFGQTGPWTDVWGFALTLVEAISGHCPLEGDQAAIFGGAIDPARRPTPRNEGADVSDAVEAIFARALAVDPRERYRDIGEFWKDLCTAAGLSEDLATIPPPGHDPRMEGNVKPATEWFGTAPAPPLPHASTEPAPPGSAPGFAAPELDLAPLEARRDPRPRPAAPRTPHITVGTGIDDFVHEPSASIGLSELDGVGLSPRPPPPRMRPVRAVEPLTSERSGSELRARLRGPVIWVLLGVAVMAFDFGYSSLNGELFAVGGVRPLWVAGPIVLLGIAAAFYRLLFE